MDAARAELVESLVRRLLAEAPERRAWEASFPRGDEAARRQLLCALMNVHARHLYERLGFTQLGTIPRGFRMKDGTFANICPYFKET